MIVPNRSTFEQGDKLRESRAVCDGFKCLFDQLPSERTNIPVSGTVVDSSPLPTYNFLSCFSQLFAEFPHNFRHFGQPRERIIERQDVEFISRME